MDPISAIRYSNYHNLLNANLDYGLPITIEICKKGNSCLYARFLYYTALYIFLNI